MTWDLVGLREPSSLQADLPTLNVPMRGTSSVAGLSSVSGVLVCLFVLKRVVYFSAADDMELLPKLELLLCAVPVGDGQRDLYRIFAQQ